MNLCRETVKMAVPPGNRRGLNPRRTLTVRSRVQGPRTPGRTVILFALAPLPSSLKLRRDKPLSPAPQAVSATSGFPVSRSEQPIHE
jgi:hypothetical protein